jgi:hypothetical protein
MSVLDQRSKPAYDVPGPIRVLLCYDSTHASPFYRSLLTSPPTRWWRGAPRWSLNTLWRAYRAALWQQHEFHPLCAPTPPDWGEKAVLLMALRHAVFAAARS